VTAPTISGQYGRSCDGPYFTVIGAKKETVAAGLLVDTWNGTATQSMSSIAITATCAGKSLTSITCPNITVKDPNAMCEYVATWCSGITLANIKAPATVSNPPVGQAGGNQCFFATNVGKLGNASNVQVNGVLIPKCGNTGWGQPTCAAAFATAGVQTSDGGYYVFIPADGNWTAQDVELSNSYAPNLHPNCEAQK